MPPLVEDSASDNDATPETDLKLGAVYLVEPLCASSAVLKFSGTRAWAAYTKWR
jgi:hypothetical protein